MSTKTIRRTERTLAVLTAVRDHPGATNTEVGEHAGNVDNGQISKLLHRLARQGALVNRVPLRRRGAPNSWYVTVLGLRVLNEEGVPMASQSEPLVYDVYVLDRRVTHVKVNAHSWAQAFVRVLDGNGKPQSKSAHVRSAHKRPPKVTK